MINFRGEPRELTIQKIAEAGGRGIAPKNIRAVVMCSSSEKRSEPRWEVRQRRGKKGKEKWVNQKCGDSMTRLPGKF